MTAMAEGRPGLRQTALFGTAGIMLALAGFLIVPAVAFASPQSDAADVSTPHQAETGPQAAKVSYDGFVRISFSTNLPGVTEQGNAIASSAVALAGFPRTGRAVGPSNGDRAQLPPDEGRGGNWTVHNKVASAITEGVRSLYAECSASVTLAVRWSGADDDFSAGTTSQQYRYLAASPKWERVGGVGRYLRNAIDSDEGVDVRPGDILVAKESEAGRNSHIAIYVGREYGEQRFPGTGVYYFESKAGDTCWTCLSRWHGSDYCVFRRTNEQLDLGGSKYRDIYPQDRLAYNLWEEPATYVYRRLPTQ